MPHGNIRKTSKTYNKTIAFDIKLKMPSNRFYVTLPCNVSSIEYFPENLVTNYITKLAQSIKLDGEWEVGLTEISFKYSWFNIPYTQDIELWYYSDNFRDLTRPGESNNQNIRFVEETINSLKYLRRNIELLKSLRTCTL